MYVRTEGMDKLKSGTYIQCKLHIIYFQVGCRNNMTVSLFFGKEEVQMQKAQYGILRFAKYKGPEISNIEAHNERKKKNMPVIRI